MECPAHSRNSVAQAAYEEDPEQNERQEMLAERVFRGTAGEIMYALWVLIFFGQLVVDLKQIVLLIFECEGTGGDLLFVN